MSDENLTAEDDLVARLDKAFEVDEDGVEVFNMSAVIPAKRRWKIGDRVYDLPAEPPVPLLLAFVDYEEKREAEDADDREVMRAMITASNLIRDHLAEHNEDVPEIDFGIQVLPMAITYLLHGKSAVRTYLEISAGGGLTEIERALADVKRLAEERGMIEADSEEGDVVPLASEKPSSPRSSRSPRSTTGRRAGGKRKASGRSGSTSKRRDAKASSTASVGSESS